MREEYIWLKAKLGAMRGFGYADQLEELRVFHEDLQQGAFAIDAAREAIEKYPALVSATEFPSELHKYLNTVEEKADAR